MKPPTYDIILDNPIETRQDVIDTLELLYKMPRPFILFVYGLSVIPNTKLAENLEKLNIKLKDISKGYLLVEPTIANAMVYMLTIFKPPRLIFDFLLKYVQPYHAKQTKHYFLLFFFRILWLFKRGIIGITHMDFTELPGRLGWWCWKLGIIKFWRKVILRKKFFKEKYVQKNSDSLLEKQETELANETSNSHRHISEIDEELAKTQSKFL